MQRHPGVEFRLHLALGLEFLVTDFTSLGWEVRLMKHRKWQALHPRSGQDMLLCYDVKPRGT